MMRILAVTPEPPYPPDQGGRIRMHNLLKRLGQNHEIHLVAVTEGHVKPITQTFLKNNFATISLLNFPRSKAYSALRLLQSLIFRKPYVIYKNTPPGLKTFLTRKIQELEIDLLLFESPYFIDSIPDQLVIPKIVDLHHLDHLMYTRFGEERGISFKKIHGIIQTPLTVQMEQNLPKLFDCCITVSAYEQNILSKIANATNIQVVPNGVNLDYFSPFQQYERKEDSSTDIVFFGTLDFYPNIDGIIFLIEKIMPIIWSKNQYITLNVVGRNPAKKIKSYAQDARVRVIGGVNDIRPYIAGAKVVVVPLRMGGGTRLKALEAASMGKAIVGTAIGLEGLNLVDQVHALVADSPNELAEKILLCLNSELTRNTLGLQARKFVEENHDWDFCADLFENVLAHSTLESRKYVNL